MSAPGANSLEIALGLRPLVADANVLLNDLVRSVRQPQARTALWSSVHLDAPVFCTRQVEQEVTRHLADPAFSRRRRLAEPIESWRCHLGQHLRVVDVVPEDWANPVFAQLAGRDESDLPTAALARLLAPSIVLSEDPDLAALGLGLSHWVPVALAYRDVALACQVIPGTLDVSVRVASSAIGHLIALARRRPGITSLLALGLAFGWASAQAAPLRSALQRAVQDAGRAGGAALRGMHIRAERLEEACQALRYTAAPLTPLARHLAFRRQPARRDSIAAALTGELGKNLARTQLRALGHHPAFVHVGDDRWQLGHTASGGGHAAS